MEQKIITIGSITFAQRARNLLSVRKITAVLVRTRAGGCSYGVRVSAEQLEEALTVLKNAGMKTEVS